MHCKKFNDKVDQAEREIQQSKREGSLGIDSQKQNYYSRELGQSQRIIISNEVNNQKSTSKDGSFYFNVSKKINHLNQGNSSYLKNPQSNDTSSSGEHSSSMDDFSNDVGEHREGNHQNRVFTLD